MKEQIQKNFTYYSPSAVQVEKYDELRQQAKEFAQTHEKKVWQLQSWKKS